MSESELGKAAQQYGKDCDFIDCQGNNAAIELQDAFEAGFMLALKWAEEWCAINAYDSDKGACDEHTIDDSRGKVCSAGELLAELRKRTEA